MNKMVYLPLHRGHTPQWLFKRMVKLGSAISHTILNDLGSREFIKRLSNPYWFQALGCALGFDWHSSGLTTVLSRVLKEIFNRQQLGIYVIGGKGRSMRSIPRELDRYDNILNATFIEDLKNISKLSARTDTILLQDGYELYHQVIIFDENKNWSLIEQGMNTEIRYARRYHWNRFDHSNKYIVEPHSGIMVDKLENGILNLIDSKSTEAKKTMIDILNSRSFRREYEEACKIIGVGLYKWIPTENRRRISFEKLIFPRKINWDKVRKAYEERPRTIPEFLKSINVNRDIARGLALIAYLIYGSEIEWKDTLKYTFTVGGKDGVPYPINVKTYDSLINYLKEAIDGSELDRKEKKEALKRLTKLRVI